MTTTEGKFYSQDDVVDEEDLDERADDWDDYDPGPECDDQGGMSEVEWPHPV